MGIRFHILTLFPEMIYSSTDHSIIKRGINEGFISINAVNIRDFSASKHKQVDDYPYGGGAGMVMMAPPVYESYLSVKPLVSAGTPVIYMSPKGKRFNQKIAHDLSKFNDLIILCGHYEGVDQRVIDEIVTEEISIGDYVLTGGELAALVVIDVVSRLVPGVLGKEQSFIDESFTDNLLEYPHYTRPSSFMGRDVPEVLLSGHHKNIEDWRKTQSVKITTEKRPDLLQGAKADE